MKTVCVLLQERNPTFVLSFTFFYIHLFFIHYNNLSFNHVIIQFNHIIIYNNHYSHLYTIFTDL